MIIHLTKWFAISGGVMPIMLMSIKAVELYVSDGQKVPYSSLYGFYLWPTSLLLLDSSHMSIVPAVLGLVISIFTNVLLYTIIGLVISRAWKMFSGLMMF